mmetsp:Transcript_137894/g.239809  ORF Transcript_137894/g.239809 Transcript_137894/m.239809 type:complete len:94 (+) Transcript_137894:39-320(+)
MSSPSPPICKTTTLQDLEQESQPSPQGTSGPSPYPEETHCILMLLLVLPPLDKAVNTSDVSRAPPPNPLVHLRCFDCSQKCIANQWSRMLSTN